MKTVNNEIEYLKNVKELLINIDMINGFIKQGIMMAPNIQRVVPRQIELIRNALASDNQGVVFVKDAHRKDAVEFNNYPKHCIENTIESELIEELKPFEKDALVYLKNSTNLIFAPRLQEDLLKLENLERVSLMGCLSEICVLNGAIGLRTFFDEINKNIEVGVYKDAIDTYNIPSHNADLVTEQALNFMKKNGIKILKKTR